MGEDDNESDEPEQGEETDPDIYAVSLSVDAILSLLSNHQRRDLLRYLIDSSDQTATIEAVLRHILNCEEERTGERPGHEQIEAALHHIHIPKLEDTGILEYDSRNQEFRYRGHDKLETWLEHIEAGETESD